MKRVRAESSQFSYTELYDCQRYYYEVPSGYSTVYLSECMKVGRMCSLVAAVGSCRSERVHSAADCWTYPVAVPMKIVGADGSMLVQGAPLASYTKLDPLSMTAVSIRVSGSATVGCGLRVGIGAGLQSSSGKFNPLIKKNNYR